MPAVPPILQRFPNPLQGRLGRHKKEAPLSASPGDPQTKPAAPGESRGLLRRAGHRAQQLLQKPKTVHVAAGDLPRPNSAPEHTSVAARTDQSNTLFDTTSALPKPAPNLTVKTIAEGRASMRARYVIESESESEAPSEVRAAARSISDDPGQKNILAACIAYNQANTPASPSAAKAILFPTLSPQEQLKATALAYHRADITWQAIIGREKGEDILHKDFYIFMEGTDPAQVQAVGPIDIKNRPKPDTAPPIKPDAHSAGFSLDYTPRAQVAVKAAPQPHAQGTESPKPQSPRLTPLPATHPPELAAAVAEIAAIKGLSDQQAQATEPEYPQLKTPQLAPQPKAKRAPPKPLPA
jgi:hypothetical protein